MVWQHLVKSWLRQQALGKVRDAAVQAAAGAASPQAAHADDAETSPCQPCHTCVIYSGQEYGSLLDRMSGVVTIQGQQLTVYQGKLDGRRVVVTLTNHEQAASVTAAVSAGHRPAWVLAAGFCSGLRSDVARGDIILADHVSNASGRRLTIELKMDPEAVRATSGLHLGPTVSLPELPRRAEQKRSMASAHGALAVDTTSFAIADACRVARVRCLVVRAVLDAPGDDLPADIEHLLRQDSIGGKLGAAAGAVFRRPGSAKDYWQQKERALTAADRLARFLTAMIAELAPRESDG